MNRLKEATSVNLYSNRSFLKWIVLIISVVIGVGSILYTNKLVEEIRDRERRTVDLYARTLEYLANENNSAGDLIFMLDEIINANTTIPVILADANGVAEDFRNLPEISEMDESSRISFLKTKIGEMRSEHAPIEVPLVDAENQVYGSKYIYYENSILLTQLQYYPYVQLLVITLFGLITFTIFNYSRTSEQNRVWVGLAKETAHQLGTPLSSLMAWVDYLKYEYPKDPNIAEFDKDVARLQMITSRFSSIGSDPKLERINVVGMIDESVAYLKTRLSSKINFGMETDSDSYPALINRDLFSWVIENLVKNAVDAMEGRGEIKIRIKKIGRDNIAINVEDTGKGIPKSKIKHVFRPGYTTKKRGWGLGLTLVKRIVENYHQGKIFIRKSDSRGTIFRIVLNIG